MISLADKAFTRKGEWTVQMIQRDCKVEDPFDLVRDINAIEEVQKRNASFHLYRRAYHVLTEAKRVQMFKDLCSQDMDEEEKVKALGEMMNESHFSCRDFYECSSDQLEELTKLCREAGALGSRLTGAGWGGCCVSLVRKSDLAGFIDKVYKFYEEKREKGKELWITDSLDRYLFATSPGQGACILDPQFTLWHQ